MTQKDLSKLTRFSQNTISNHENGNRSLDEDDIIKYASALGVSPEFLFEQLELAEKNLEIEYDISENFSKIAENKIAELYLDKQKIAKTLNISLEKLENWLQGNYGRAPISKLGELCKILNISPRHLINKLDFFESYEEYKLSNEMLKEINTTFMEIPFSSREEIYKLSNRLKNNKDNIVRMPTREEMTLAAHSADPKKIFTKEEIQKIHDYLDELDAEYDRKHGINKNDDK